MDDISNIQSFIDSKISILPNIVLFDNINFKCITESGQLEWLDIPNITSIHYEKIYKSTITLDNNEQKLICIKASSAHSLLNTEGKETLTYYTTTLGNISQKMNTLRENYTYFTYTYNSSFIKSNVVFFNSEFLKWKNNLLNKYVNLEFIEYLDNYSQIKTFFEKFTFVNNLKLLVKIIDIIKILIDNTLLHGDLGIYNVLAKGEDIETMDIKVIDYENMVDLSDNPDINLNSQSYNIRSSVYQEYEYNAVQMKDVEFYDTTDEANKPTIFCYVYQLDYLRLLSSFTQIYLNKPEFTTIYNIIKHCVDNHLSVVDAKAHIETVITSLENP